MAYESGYLNKLRALAGDHVNGKLDFDEFCKKAQALYKSKRVQVKNVIQDSQSDEAFEYAPRGAQASAEATDLLEEGFQLWFEYMAWEPPHEEEGEEGEFSHSENDGPGEHAQVRDEKHSPNLRLIEEGLEKMKEANDLLNKSRDLFLDAAEEDPVQLMF